MCFQDMGFENTYMGFRLSPPLSFEFVNMRFERLDMRFERLDMCFEP